MRKNSVIIRDGWFQGRNAELKSNRVGHWVLIDGENDFCIQNGHVTNLTVEDRVRGIEDEVLRIYALLRREQV